MRGLQDKDDWLALLPELHPNQATVEMDLNDLHLSQDITQSKEVAEKSEATPWSFSLILREQALSDSSERPRQLLSKLCLHA